MSPVPNIISVSRGVAAVAMLFFPVFSHGFCLPFAIIPFDILLPAVFICIVATFSLLEDIQILRKRKIRYHLKTK